MDRYPTIFPHRTYAERGLPVKAASAKRRKRARSGGATNVILEEEQAIGSMVEIWTTQEDSSTCALPCSSAALPTSSGSPERLEVMGAEPQHEKEWDHKYAVGPVSEAAVLYKARVEILLTTCRELQEKNDKLQKENSHLAANLTELESRLHNEKLQRAQEKVSTTKGTTSFEEVFKDERWLQFYTGFTSLPRFEFFVQFIEAKHAVTKTSNTGRRTLLSVREQLLLILCRLRVGLLEEDLAYRFGVSSSTISNLFSYWVDFLHDILVQITIWPSRQTVSINMPESFKALYPSTRVILDCTELFIEAPSDYSVQGDTFSTYKSHNTAKGLIGIAPNGFISFVSDLSPGRISDREITRQSGLYNLLEPGDSVMADRGFLIRQDLEELGVSLNIPPMMNGRKQLSASDEKKTRSIANLRIHVERVIREVKKYRILHGVFPNAMACKLNKIWKICCYLNHFTHEPLLDRQCSVVRE
ncbi:uncharacterized protein LOC119406039 isoform X2 [Rhipicephalus sanguineus]|nr:uncharacterized protein LOC119406039 isoform X2 [Rhipicephalus sanguineus]